MCRPKRSRNCLLLSLSKISKQAEDHGLSFYNVAVALFYRIRIILQPNLWRLDAFSFAAKSPYVISKILERRKPWWAFKSSQYCNLASDVIGNVQILLLFGKCRLQFILFCICHQLCYCDPIKEAVSKSRVLV